MRGRAPSMAFYHAAFPLRVTSPAKSMMADVTEVRAVWGSGVEATTAAWRWKALAIVRFLTCYER